MRRITQLEVTLKRADEYDCLNVRGDKTVYTSFWKHVRDVDIFSKTSNHDEEETRLDAKQAADRPAHSIFLLSL